MNTSKGGGPGRDPAPQSSMEQRRALDRIAALLAANDLEPAATAIDAFLAASPRHAAALHLGGIVALRQGRHARAVERLRQAAIGDPRNALLLSDLGTALASARRLGEAETAYRAAAALRPDLSAITLNLADLLVSQARDDEAARLYEQVLEKSPDQPKVLDKLAALQMKLKLPRVAAETARRALALEPDMPGPLYTLGAALDTLGDYEEAVQLRQHAMSLEPAAAGRAYDLGMTYMHYGHLQEAETAFRRAIELDPARGDWHRALSMVVRHRERDADIDAMERVRRSNSASLDDRMHVAFGLGKALDDIGAYEEAFNYFLEGNRLKRENLRYSSSETDRLFDTVKSAFTPERTARLAGRGHADPTPIFVLGMPRSGTSLVEQILAAHPEVNGGGEFRLVNQIVGEFARGPGFPLAAALDAAPAGQFKAMGERYVAHVRQLSAGARFITDKLPGNFIMIGMIRLMLPEARIIHCRRDPVDTSLSLFKNYFAADHLRYAYDLHEIGHYYWRYQDLMAHWHEVLPGAVYDVDYETLVADFDTEARKLVAYCGLDWRDECRDFYKARRPVDTASAAQVRRPIYASSIGQGARYGDRIKPLLEGLAGR